MSDIILHHYPASPFAEKIRAILGYKQLPYRSVDIPLIMPKPDLTALTGGYRKTPVLQLGAHIYCDTRLMAAVLEQRAPQPTLLLPGHEATAAIMAQWIDANIFELSVASVFSPAGIAALQRRASAEALQALIEDRMAMRKNAAPPPATAEKARSLLPVYLAQFEQQLAGGRDYLLAQSPSLADFSLYHCLWFIAGNEGVAPLLDDYPQVKTWLGRMAAFGRAAQAGATELSSAEALQIARDSNAGGDTADWYEPLGFAPGTRVSVLPADTRQDPVAGELVLARRDEVGLRREHPQGGQLIVHFPRVGYEISAA